MEVVGDGWKGGRYDGDVDGDDKRGDADCEKDEPEAPAFAHFWRRGLGSFLIGQGAKWLDGRQSGVSLAVSLNKRRHDNFGVTVRKVDVRRRFSRRQCSEGVSVGSPLAWLF